MALMNYFVNIGNISFSGTSCFQPFGAWNFNFCNFSMPNFFNQFTFNFNQPYTLNQNIFTQPYFNNNFNFSHNTQQFKSDNRLNYSSVFNYPSTPISISDFYSTNTTSINNAPISTSFNKTTSSISATTKRDNQTPKTSTKTTGLLGEYNANKGNKLANIAMHNAGYIIDSSTKKITSRTKDPDKFTSYCTRYVKAAIRDAGLGEYYNANSAYQMTSYLRKNDNFKEISSSTPLKDIPAGCILVYDRGVGGYSSEDGHIEIKTNDGRAVSDGITDNLYKRPSHIFMPV